MKRPEMLLFDYGETLLHSTGFDALRGTRAVLQYAEENPENVSAEEVQVEADRINRELGRGEPAKRHLAQIEVHTHLFQQYLYTSFGIRLRLSNEETERVFWDAAEPVEPTAGIQEFLRFLQDTGIRAGVVSNLSCSGNALRERLHRFFPETEFAFVIASSEYVFRKPNPRIFRLALRMAGLPPEKVWYCGDDWNCDIAGAAQVGIQPVWYTKYLESSEVGRLDCPVIQIENWIELQRILENTMK